MSEGNFAHDQSRAQTRMHMEELTQQEESHLQNLSKESQARVEKFRDMTAEANLRAEKTYQGRFQTTMDQHEAELANVQGATSRQLHELRADTAQKLSAYGARQQDPFYKMVKVGAELSDDGNAFMLTAHIPEHEQKHINISVKGNNIVLTGFRRNEEKLEISPGRTQGTHSFQSFQETFPINWPVDPHQITKRFDGERMTIRIPKLDDYSTYQAKIAEPPKPEKIRVQRPDFPADLPITQSLTHAHGGENPISPTPQGKGSGTLS